MNKIQTLVKLCVLTEDTQALGINIGQVHQGYWQWLTLSFTNLLITFVFENMNFLLRAALSMSWMLKL